MQQKSSNLEEFIEKEDEDKVPCFRCDGTKVNRKGMPCRRCNGTGVTTNKFFKELTKILKEEIQSYT